MKLDVVKKEKEEREVQMPGLFLAFLDTLYVTTRGFKMSFSDM